MRHLQAAALAIHLGPGVRAIELNVLDSCTRDDPKRPLTPLLFQPLPDVLIDLDVAGEIVLSGLDDGARGRGGIPAPLQFHRTEEGAVGYVIVRVNLIEGHIPRPEADALIRPGAHRLEVIRRSAG